LREFEGGEVPEVKGGMIQKKLPILGKGKIGGVDCIVGGIIEIKRQIYGDWRLIHKR